MERVCLEHRGQKIEGSIFVPHGDGPFPAVILLHGLTSSEKSYADAAQMLTTKGILSMTINMRGHGGSDGNLMEMNAQELTSDGNAAYDFIAQRADIDASRIGMCGGSFGGLVAAMTTTGRSVKSLLLRAPAAYSEEMLHTKFKDLMPREKQMFFELTDPAGTRAVRALTDFTGNLLVVASELDDIIAPAIPQAFYDQATKAARREIEVMAGAPHSLSPSPLHKQQFNERALKWFSETL